MPSSSSSSSPPPASAGSTALPAAPAVLRIVSTLAGLVFLLAAAAQYNDSDVLAWAGLYLSAAAICAYVAGVGRLSWGVPTLVGLVALGWALVLAFRGPAPAGPGQLFEAWTMSGASIEKGREVGGLLIVAAWMGVLAGTAFVKRRALHRSEGHAGEA